MSPSTEQITAFEDQIENSLDFQVEKLREIDVEKSKLLSSIKDSILNSIKQEREDDLSTPEKEEKLSEDLLLTKKEFELIFKEVKENNPEIFSKNKIEKFSQFKSLIGLHKNNTSSFKNSLEKVRLFKNPINFSFPIEISRKAENNFIRIFKAIEERKNLELFITNDTEFLPKWPLRITFSIQKNLENIEYLATPDGVFRIEIEAPKDKKKEFLDLKLIELKFKQKLLKSKNNSNLTVEQQSIIKKTIYNKKLNNEDKKITIPEKYKNIIKKLLEIRKKKVSTGKESLKQTLFDENNNLIVLETWNPENGGFKHEYITKDGKIKKEINYKFREKDNMIEYQEDWMLKSISLYREDWTLKTKKAGNHEYTYDKSGKIVIYKESKGKWKVIKKVAIGESKKEIWDFNYEISLNPSMTNLEYAEKVESVIKTREQFFIFEENMIKYDKYNKNLINELRKYGREITGIKEEEERLEQKYGFQIETEKHPISLVSSKKIYLKDIPKKFQKIEEIFDKYPKSIISKFGIKNIGIFSHQVFKKDKNWTEHFKWGSANTNWEVLVNNIWYAFHHELLHMLDHINWNISYNENNTWATNAHGENWSKDISEWGAYHHESGKEAITAECEAKDITGYEGSYGKCWGPNEDQATVAEALFKNDPDFLNRVKKEPILAKKVQMIKELYFVLSDWEMDEEYWEDIKNNEKINDEYWKKKEGKKWKLGYENPSPYYFLVKANILEKNKDEKWLIEMTKKHPNKAEFYTSLGSLYVSEFKNETKAQEYFLLAIKHNSASSIPYIEMSDIYMKQKNVEKQILILELAIKNLSNTPEAIFLELWDSYIQVDKKNKAIEMYEKIVELDLIREEILIYLYYSHKKDLNKARNFYLKNFEPEIKNNPEGCEYQNRLGIFYGSLIEKTITENLSQFNKNYDSIKINSDFLKQYPNIALLHSEKTKALIEVCKNDESTINDFEELSQLYYEQGKENLSLRVLEKAIKKFENTKHYNKYKNLTSKAIAISLTQGGIEKAVQISEKHNGPLDTVPKYISRMDVSQEVAIKFFDRLISNNANAATYYDYTYYLKEGNQTEKLKIIVEEAIKKFPNQKEDFKAFLRN